MSATTGQRASAACVLLFLTAVEANVIFDDQPRPSGSLRLPIQGLSGKITSQRKWEEASPHLLWEGRGSRMGEVFFMKENGFTTQLILRGGGGQHTQWSGPNTEESLMSSNPVLHYGVRGGGGQGHPFASEDDCGASHSGHIDRGRDSGGSDRHGTRAMCGMGLISGLLRMRTCFGGVEETRKYQSKDPAPPPSLTGPSQRTGSVPRELEERIATFVHQNSTSRDIEGSGVALPKQSKSGGKDREDGGSNGGMAALDAGDVLRRKQRLDAIRARANEGFTQAGALVSMSPVALEGYEGGYAALHWNADGTCAQGIVPVRYESSCSSTTSHQDSSVMDSEGAEPHHQANVSAASHSTSMGRWRLPTSPRAAVAMFRAEGKALQRKSPECWWGGRGKRGGRSVKKEAARSADDNAKYVSRLWEQQDFQTYVSLNEGDACDEHKSGEVNEIAQKWQAASHPARARLFTAERQGEAHICATRGRRGAMEDTFACHPAGGVASGAVLDGKWRLFGLFDGHGGDKAALYCRNHLLRNVVACYGGEGMRGALEKGFDMTDRHFVADAERNEWMDGSTALVVAIRKDEIYIANAGDSRAVLGVTRQSGVTPGEEVCEAVVLSKDHSPEDPEEQRRIEALGGIVVSKGGTARVMGVLGVARALGNAQLRPYVTAEPDVRVIPRADEHAFLIIATDGFWDSVSNQEAVEHVHSLKLNPLSSGNYAEALAREAYNRGSTDNISVIVLDLSTAQLHRTFPSSSEEDDVQAKI